MDNNCQLVVFSDKAYNAIIRETFEWDPVETGGILLGHILDNGYWIVMEVLPPGYGEGREGDNVYHEYGYFEYNRKFVNYLAKSVAEQYEIPLELLGLWHRHPGSMDHFSGTDDGTNTTFASQNPQGVISGLVNIDPQLRLTMYYLPHAEGARHYGGRPNYQEVGYEVGSDLIPEEYFKLRYYQGEERQLHPYAPQRNDRQRVQSRYVGQEAHSETSEPINAKRIVREQIQGNNHRQRTEEANTLGHQESLSAVSDITEALKKNKTLVILAIAMIAFAVSVFSIKNDIIKAFHFFGAEKEPPAVIVHQPANDEGGTKATDKGENPETPDFPKGEANQENPAVDSSKTEDKTNEQTGKTNQGQNQQQEDGKKN